MKVTIIGAGNLARGIASRLLAGDHKVTLHARDIDRAGVLAAQLQQDAPRTAMIDVKLLGAHIQDRVVIFALPYDAISDVIESDYGDILAGKILVDTSNPINFNTLELVTPPGSSGAEEIARLLPFEACVIKAFNTTFAATLVTGTVAGHPLDVFIAGDNPAAKMTISELVQDGEMHPIDAGPLTNARLLETLQLIHISLQTQLQSHGMSAIKIIY